MKFLIIEDDHVEADLIERRLKILFPAAQYVKALGDSSVELSETVRHLVAEHGPFRGTTLDIMYKNEKDGGIVLWSGLPEEIRNQCGILCIVTKNDPKQDKELRKFVDDYAAGRIITTFQEDGMLSHLRDFFAPPEDARNPLLELENFRNTLMDLEARIKKLEAAAARKN